MNGSSRVPPQEIADILRERIRAGELKAGDRLPTQAELAEEFGVERGTVRQALRALQEDGLLSNVSKGSPPRIAEPAPAREEPRPTTVGLAPRLTEAFSTAHVRIDAVCLTAESLMLALSEPVRHIHEGRIRPESIDVRLLLLRATHGVEVRVSFRALPFTPPVKLYLLNGEEALIGYYLLTRREEEWESHTLEMYDALGAQSLLFPFVERGGRRERAFVEESQKWFDALWETITTDLTLS